MTQYISNFESWFEKTFAQSAAVPSSGIIVIILAIILGLINCFLGYRVFKYLIGILGFIFGAFIGYAIGAQFTKYWWVCLICALVLGIILYIVSMKLYYVGCFLVTGIPAALFTCALLSMYVHSLPTAAVCVIGIIVGILVGILTVMLQRPLIIITSSLHGAYSVIYGIFKLASFTNGNLLFLLTIVLAIVGIVFQFVTTKEEKK